MKGGTELERGDDNASDAAEGDSLQTRIVQSAEQVANSASATHNSCSPAADAIADVERLETSPLARGAGAACGGATALLGSATRRTEY